MSAHRRATSRGMRRWWAKKKSIQDIRAMQIESAIRSGWKRERLPDLDLFVKERKLRVEQARSLKKLMEKSGL